MTVITIANRVWVCPLTLLRVLNGRLCLGFSFLRAIVFQVAFVHFDSLVKFDGLVF